MWGGCLSGRIRFLKDTVRKASAPSQESATALHIKWYSKISNQTGFADLISSRQCFCMLDSISANIRYQAKHEVLQILHKNRDGFSKMIVSKRAVNHAALSWYDRAPRVSLVRQHLQKVPEVRILIVHQACSGNSQC